MWAEIHGFDGRVSFDLLEVDCLAGSEGECGEGRGGDDVDALGEDF